MIVLFREFAQHMQCRDPFARIKRFKREFGDTGGLRQIGTDHFHALLTQRQQAFASVVGVRAYIDQATLLQA